MHRRGQWSLVTQITCLTLAAASGLFTAGATGTVVSPFSITRTNVLHYENVEYAVTNATNAYNRHRQGGASIATHAMTSLVAPSFRSRANTKDAPDGSERGNRKYSEAPTSDHRQGGASIATHAMTSLVAPSFWSRANTKDWPAGSERGNRKYSEAPTSDHRQGGASIATHAMTSLVAPSFWSRANTKDWPAGSERGNRKYSEAPTSDHRQGGGSLATHAMTSPAAPLLRPRVRNESDGALPCARWISLRHISKKFVAVRSLHVQASALGRAVLGTVFFATSLLVVASLFALVWCFCRSCRGAKKEDNPLATRTPPPAYTAPKGGSFGGMHSVLIDPPPPYGSVIDSTTASVHCIGTRQPNSPVPSQGADQPPAYDASMSSSASPQTASAIPRL
ncbi:uncharacterized protein [Dermacentor albipictus]|uniref:uncharacterized protein n=1 Tax=Dermacentor albipictus TaxID=60249 RepID=UPI0031FC92E3